MKDRIKLVLDESGLKQKEAAARLGVTATSVSNWVKGNAVPTAAARASICATFGVRREWLETGQGAMYANARDCSLSSATLEELQKAYIEKLVESLPADVQRLVIQGIKDYLDAKAKHEEDERRRAEVERLRERVEREREEARRREKEEQERVEKENRKYWEDRHAQGIAGTWKNSKEREREAKNVNTFEKVDVVNVDQRTNANDDGLERLLAIQRERRKAFGLEDE